MHLAPDVCTSSQTRTPSLDRFRHVGQLSCVGRVSPDQFQITEILRHLIAARGLLSVEA